jgi:hypothetical protein
LKTVSSQIKPLLSARPNFHASTRNRFDWHSPIRIDRSHPFLSVLGLRPYPQDAKGKIKSALTPGGRRFARYWTLRV